MLGVHKPVFQIKVDKMIKDSKYVTPKCSICCNFHLCFNYIPNDFDPFPCDGFQSMDNPSVLFHVDNFYNQKI